MSDSSSELRRTLLRINSELNGEARSAALEQHVEAVSAADDQPLLNQTLADLVNSYEFSMDASRIIVPFARLLHNYDTAPEHFDASTTHRVYWMFKWVIYKMIEHPDIPLESVEEWLSRFRSRYAEAGHSLHPVHEAEQELADHLGDAERAAKAVTAMNAAEPDRMSNCKACRCHNLGWIAACDGEHERAVELWSPVLEGNLRCAHEPHAALASSLLSLVALGRLDQARANHMRGYLMIRDKDDMTYAVARHLRFCALTGNEARAIEIIAAHDRFYELRLSLRERRYLLEGVQVTCAALMSRGMGDTEVPGPENRAWRAAELHSWADAERRAINERYDRRNGNDAQSRSSDARAAFEDAYPHVPLGLRTLTPARRPKRTAPQDERPSPERFETALAEAREATAAFAESAHELWRRVDRLAQGLGVELGPSDLAEVLTARIDPDAGLDSALEQAERAREVFLAAGLEGRALANRASVLVWSVGADPEAVPAEVRRILDDARRVAATDPANAVRARALAHIALIERCRHRGERPDEELRAAVVEVDAALAELPDEPRAGQARARLTLTMASMETEAEARTAAMRAAFEQASSGDHSYETFLSAGEYASALNMAGRFEAGLEVAETGLASVVPELPAFPVAALHLTAAECAVNLGRWSAAERHAMQAAVHYDRARETGCAGVARHLMGLALASQGRHEEAAVMLAAALDDLPSMDEQEHWRLVDVRFLLAASYERLRNPRAGSEHALEALRLIDGGLVHPNPTVYARAAHLAGRFLGRIDENEAAVQCYRRAEEAWRALGALPAAANSIRALVWLAGNGEDSPQRRSGSATMAALAEELRSDWGDEELPPEYREACRREVGETLMQHARFLQHGDESEPLLREAISVAADGEFLAEQATEAAHWLMNSLNSNGDADGARACADEVLKRLNAAEHERLIAGLERHRRQLGDANGQ
ncbi:hypothetical protein [Glycomyces tenuis]|uniref:hypothetical protein n=1 Tax=Glycomyces tenuis TaxID=58116 RepID=UPI00041F1F92|nr:hypothetical protein [Glycomyces tenuis]